MTTSNRQITVPKLPAPWEDFFQHSRESRMRGHRWRTLNINTLERSKDHLDISSNDYLSIGSSSGGSGSSQLINGYHLIHDALCKEIERWTSYESSRLFSSGYQANAGIIPSISDSNTVIFSDELNHASIVDGCRLSRASLNIYPHRDLSTLSSMLDRHLKNTADLKPLIISETLFSMEGSFADVRSLRSLASRYGALLYLDEAHSLGLFGPQGSGYARSMGTMADLSLCTFGKAIGSSGAALCTSTVISDHITNFCRSFIYSTAPSINVTEATLNNIKYVASEQGNLLRKTLTNNIKAFNTACVQRSLPVGGDRHSPIRYINTSTNEQALAYASTLRDRGIGAIAIRPPTVPTPRIRVVITTAVDVPQLVSAIAQIV